MCPREGGEQYELYGLDNNIILSPYGMINHS